MFVVVAVYHVCHCIDASTPSFFGFRVVSLLRASLEAARGSMGKSGAPMRAKAANNLHKVKQSKDKDKHKLLIAHILK